MALGLKKDSIVLWTSMRKYHFSRACVHFRVIDTNLWTPGAHFFYIFINTAFFPLHVPVNKEIVFYYITCIVLWARQLLLSSKYCFALKLLLNMGGMRIIFRTIWEKAIHWSKGTSYNYLLCFSAAWEWRPLTLFCLGCGRFEIRGMD